MSTSKSICWVPEAQGKFGTADGSLTDSFWSAIWFHSRQEGMAWARQHRRYNFIVNEHMIHSKS